MFWFCRFGVEFERLGTTHFELEVLESSKAPREIKCHLPSIGSCLIILLECSSLSVSHVFILTLVFPTCLWTLISGSASGEPKSIIYIHIQYIPILWSTCLDPICVLSVCLSIYHISTYLPIHSPICLSTYLSIILNRATQCSFLKNADSWRARRERIKKSGRE